MMPSTLPGASPDKPATRDLTFDILKGIGILEVMIHHLLAYSTRKFAAPDAPEWWAFTLANRVLHFAVPTFLLASALLLARSMAGKPRPDWKRYYLRRAERSLWPYLVWTFIYLFFRLAVVRSDADMEAVPVSLPLFGSFHGPALLADRSEWIRNLAWGKAYYHLYFMSVLLQFSLFFPVLFYGLRRRSLSFGALMALSLALQGVVYWLQAALFAPKFGFTTPASMALWYVPALLGGMWIGLNWAGWPAVWRAWRAPVALVTAVALSGYLTLSVQLLRAKPISSLAFNFAALLFATGMALLLLSGSSWLARRPRIGRPLAAVGDRSLPLFLLHPMALYFLGGPRLSDVLDRLPLSPLWAGILLFGLSWLLIDLTRWIRADRLLFGRRFTR